MELVGPHLHWVEETHFGTMHFDDQSLVPILRPDLGLGASFFQLFG